MTNYPNYPGGLHEKITYYPNYPGGQRKKLLIIQIIQEGGIISY